MTDREIEPDAWKFTETIDTIEGDRKETQQASLLHPDSDEFRFYVTGSHEIEIEESLFSESSIVEEITDVLQSKVKVFAEDDNKSRTELLHEIEEELKEVFTE